MNLINILLTLTTLAVAEKINFEALNNYSVFLNFGDKKLSKLKKGDLENAIIKSKVEVLGEIFKTNIEELKQNGVLDIVFLIDASSSVGEKNFKSELKFVKKLLSDVPVDYNHTRIAIVLFSSSDKVIKVVDEITIPRKENHKCLLLNHQLNSISFTGGGTYTLGAFKIAQEIFQNSRKNSKKVLFLITDGFSNGGDPTPLSSELKKNQTTVFTIGIQNGNYKELYDLASSPGERYSYLLDSFEEFESLARRALHADLKIGDYIPLGISSPCDNLCEDGDCCDSNAVCACGTSTGHYSCVCRTGFYGTGLKDSCSPCPMGFYSDGPNLCTPCPDIHHTTKPPAYGVESCKCKVGYQATRDHQCEILKCPNVKVPENAYFVKKRRCDVVLNTACGIRCEVGYSLVGSSIRLCQSNGTWSGEEASCEVRKCEKLQPPTYGSMNCSHYDLGVEYTNETDLPVDTVCSFNCEKGTALIGSSQRTCLPLARWDGLRTSCKHVKCNKLTPIAHGKIEPSSCTLGKQPYGKKCFIECDDGFVLKGPKVKSCVGKHGSWDTKFKRTHCKDITPPVILCPENITASTDPGKNFGLISLKGPNVTDNSGLNVSIWMKPASNFIFGVGVTKITYFAQDASQNKANCTTYVIIKDEEKPTIEGCVNPPTFLTNNNNGANISWEEPHIFDNSDNVTVLKSHEFGYFEIGTTAVIYTALDPSNNTNTCKINITVEVQQCEPLPDPVYGEKECSSEKNALQCVITCEEGYAIPLLQPTSVEDLNLTSTTFMCNHSDPAWYSPGTLFPECSVSEVPKAVEQNGSVEKNVEPKFCNNINNLKELENEVNEVLTKACTGGCLTNLQTSCLDKNEDLEEATNIIKRSADHNLSKKRKQRKKHRKKKVSIKFQIIGQTFDQSKINSSNLSFKFQKAVYFCPLGFTPRKNRCVQCPKGTFHNVTTNRCNSCPFGSYNDKYGQIGCTPCPLHHSTIKLHAKSLLDCKEQCPPGTHARKKVIKRSKWMPNATLERATLMPFCRSCPRGYYQPSYGELYCVPCPLGFTTPGYGSRFISDCLPTADDICKNSRVCNNGICIAIDMYNYACECFDNYVGSTCDTKISKCASNPCLNGGTCVTKENYTSLEYECLCSENYTGLLCEEFQSKCPINCLNGGTCVESDNNEFICLCSKEFGGEHCENQVNHCEGKICENNGFCVEEGSGYKCICPDGFFGKRCNILPCDFKPCPGNSICINVKEVNASKNSFKCSCPESFTGKLCADKIDFCGENPCINGGTCVSEQSNYKCVCSVLYTGRNCEVERQTNYLLNFIHGDTTDYVKLHPPTKNLTEISVCLWMQTSDNFNYGTLVSYATKNFDNAFTLTDYTGLVLYVNNKYVVTDIFLNDGKWHHICLSWSNINGSFNVFGDGNNVKSGHGLASGQTIEGFGNFIIGQEQDIMGGRFSQAESFIGKMAYIDIWGKFLSSEERLQHFERCQNLTFGDIHAWPEIKDYVHGNILVENSTFCELCQKPNVPKNGFVTIRNNTAYYKCDKGFKILGDYNGRRCTKASKWEGYLDPICEKIYCGYPGYIKYGYSFGRSYSYNDVIRFQCYPTYQLKGPASVVCKENGKWYPGIPHCEGVKCNSLNKLNYNNITLIGEHSYEDLGEGANAFSVGVQIEIICKEGEIISGNSILTCLENGTWDYPPPTCEKDPSKSGECSIEQTPPPPENGYIDIDSIQSFSAKETDYVTYKCRNGYKLVGKDQATCIVDGYWTELNITCHAIKCKPPKLTNILKLKNEQEIKSNDSYIFGNMVTYTCAEGYRMLGNGVVRCQANGRWSRLTGRCARISCRKPDVSAKTTIQGNSYLYEDTVNIICPEGQYLLKCNKFGMWEGRKGATC